MAVNPAGPAVRLAISDILSKFMSKHEWGDGTLATLRQQVCEMFNPTPVDVHGLSGLFGRSSDLELRDQHRFLFLEPVVEKKILPLLTLETSNQWVNFRAYVLLTMLDQCDGLQALAIRFETDEGPQKNGVTGSHDFCHAQLCRSVNRTTRATTPCWLPESQPSLPLDAEDQVGVILCMLTSLYGGRHVVRRLNTVGDRDLSKHLRKVRALRLNRSV